MFEFLMNAVRNGVDVQFRKAKFPGEFYVRFTKSIEPYGTYSMDTVFTDRTWGSIGDLEASCLWYLNFRFKQFLKECEHVKFSSSQKGRRKNG